MASLRRRIYALTGALLALQVAGTALGFASWGAVTEAGATLQQLADERAAFLSLARATREEYVHQAHTLIEGGPGHLGHLDSTDHKVEALLASVDALPLPVEAPVEPVRAALAASSAWFEAEVLPRAEVGTLDRPTAVRLHADAERHADAVEAAVAVVLTELDAADRRERIVVAEATRRAWFGVAALTLGGLGLGLLVASRLVRAVLEPVTALQRSALAFGEGRDGPPAPTGEDELGVLGAAFNDMVERVGEGERRRIQMERLAALGELSGAVAHELMNPLTVILSDPAMRAPEVAASRGEAEHARRVVEGLLGFARPGEEEARVVDLGRAVQSAADRAATIAELRDVTVRCDRGEGAEIVASPSAVRQVLDNLLRNAVDASPPGAEVTITLRGAATVEIADRGAGIPPAVRERLYQPFVTGRPLGTGLGLAVCYRIVRAQGGALTHLDRPGGGTVARWELKAPHG